LSNRPDLPFVLRPWLTEVMRPRGRSRLGIPRREGRRIILEDRRDVDREIQETLGLVPEFFKRVPDYLVPTEWPVASIVKTLSRVRSMRTITIL
jgi:hypothetical protein